MNTMPKIDRTQIARGIAATQETMQVTFEGHVFTKPYGSRLTLTRREDGSLSAGCNKTGWFNKARVFQGENQFKQLQDWLDEMIGHSQDLQFIAGR